MGEVIEIYHFKNTRSHLSQLRSYLCVQEREKADRFVFEQDRDQFVFCRGALRKILSEHLSCQPIDIQFEYGPNGKPKLCCRHHNTLMQFNLSHTKGYALIAVTPFRQLGVDIEYLRPIENLDSLMKSSLSESEIQQVHLHPVGKQVSSFLQYWTSKEALLKAWGIGLQDSLPSYECKGQSPLYFYDQMGKLWTVLHVVPGPEHIAAIACEGGNLPVVHFLSYL